VYDLTSNNLTPHLQLDSMAAQAGHILSRPHP
jgi:hypothetical protein